MKKIIFAIIVFSFINVSFAQKSVRKEIQNKIDFYKLINIADMRADENFLAAPELEGREIGERGNNIAALYIKGEFEKAGLKPVNNTYFQYFYIQRTSAPKNSCLKIINKNSEIEEAEIKKDFYPVSTGKTDEEISAEIVFAGYGITSPENGYDDYKNLDVKGKIVLLLTNTPQENDFSSVFGGKNAEKYKFKHQIKLKNAMEHGAIGVLFMMEKGSRSLNLYVKSYGPMLGKKTYKMIGAQPISDSNSIPLAYVTKNFADKLLQGSDYTIDQIINKIDSNLVPISFPIKDKIITFRHGIKKELLTCANVYGFLEGTDPVLKNEVVVLSGHYDHLGISAEGKIYPGADDNASGITAIINIARAYKQAGLQPKRSILFLADNGEEKGLFGSEFYSMNPLFPMNKTYIDLNIDMIGRIDEKYEKANDKNYIYIIGPKIMGGDLLRLNEEANKESTNLFFDYLYDDKKDPNIFYLRSDHINFAKHKVPIIDYFSGEHKDYHKVTDIVERLDFELMKKRTVLIGYTCWKFANNNDPIKIERTIP